MVTVKNEILFYILLVVIALLHIIFSRIANIYDRKVYEVENDNDTEWLKTVKPFVDMTSSFVISSLILYLIFIIAVVVVYGFKNTLLPILGVTGFSIYYAYLDERKTKTLFGQTKIDQTEERLLNLISIEKENRKK